MGRRVGLTERCGVYLSVVQTAGVQLIVLDIRSPKDTRQPPDPVTPGLCRYYWKYVLTEHRNEDERKKHVTMQSTTAHRKVYAWKDPSV